MTDAYWDTASKVCTHLELETLKLSVKGQMSLRAIAYSLDLSVSTVRSRLFNANRKIQIELRKAA